MANLANALKKNTSNEGPSRVGLIGARGYTDQTLIDLLNNHPNMDLCCNLSPKDIVRLDEDVMTVPNNTCQSFVEALGQSSSIIVDLLADYWFDPTGEWTYSLSELVKRSKIARSTRISNPGRYGTVIARSSCEAVGIDKGPPAVPHDLILWYLQMNNKKSIVVSCHTGCLVGAQYTFSLDFLEVGNNMKKARHSLLMSFWLSWLFGQDSNIISMGDARDGPWVVTAGFLGKEHFQKAPQEPEATENASWFVGTSFKQIPI
ncbi:hypothetical protein NM208_g11206 [Fusarium decemcellulare]|uniref:Uncharacterized protein n=1 Tax=Fusarium decemcellulare TaxID=57161 RepID=A0ACC1RVA6_9HYPO|nr:hypothetical protein NM208_g11206 [Fusarium decemcellulare]